MKISNPTGSDAIKTSGTLEELSQAINAVDISKLPKHERWRAIQRQMARFVMVKTKDPKERAKPAFEAMHRTYTETTGLLL